MRYEKFSHLFNFLEMFAQNSDILFFKCLLDFANESIAAS